MNRFALMLALAAGIACAAFGYEPQRHDDTFTTNGVTYAQRGGLGASDYVVTNIDASAVGKVQSVNGKVGDVELTAYDADGFTEWRPSPNEEEAGYEIISCVWTNEAWEIKLHEYEHDTPIEATVVAPRDALMLTPYSELNSLVRERKPLQNILDSIYGDIDYSTDNTALVETIEATIPTNMAWSAITNTPSTLQGYRITDAVAATNGTAENLSIKISNSNYLGFSARPDGSIAIDKSAASHGVVGATWKFPAVSGGLGTVELASTSDVASKRDKDDLYYAELRKAPSGSEIVVEYGTITTPLDTEYPAWKVTVGGVAHTLLFKSKSGSGQYTTYRWEEATNYTHYLSIGSGGISSIKVSGNVSGYGNFSQVFPTPSDALDCIITNFNDKVFHCEAYAYADNKIALISDIPTNMEWSAITDTPTTLSGYGITDAVTTTAFNEAVAQKRDYDDLNAPGTMSGSSLPFGVDNWRITASDNTDVTLSWNSTSNRWEGGDFYVQATYTSSSYSYYVSVFRNSDSGSAQVGGMIGTASAVSDFVFTNNNVNYHVYVLDKLALTSDVELKRDKTDKKVYDSSGVSERGRQLAQNGGHGEWTPALRQYTLEDGDTFFNLDSYTMGLDTVLTLSEDCESAIVVMTATVGDNFACSIRTPDGNNAVWLIKGNSGYFDKQVTGVLPFGPLPLPPNGFAVARITRIKKGFQALAWVNHVYLFEYFVRN